MDTDSSSPVEHQDDFLMPLSARRSTISLAVELTSRTSGGSTISDKVLECGDLSPLSMFGRLAGQTEPRSAARSNATLLLVRRRQVACPKLCGCGSAALGPSVVKTPEVEVFKTVGLGKRMHHRPNMLSGGQQSGAKLR